MSARGRRINLALGALLALLMIAATPASAKVIHETIGSFNGSDAPGGPFGPLLVSAAVDQSSGDVYVAEGSFEGGGVVDKFNASGQYAKVHLTGAKTPQKAFSLGFAPGVAVDNSPGIHKGDLYVADTNHGVVDRYSESGAFLCQVTGREPVTAAEKEHECNGAAGSATPECEKEPVGCATQPTGVAVDASGDLYVADDAHAVIDEFGEEGQFIGQITDPHLSSGMGTIALNPAGHLYVQLEASGGGTRVIEFDAGGAFVSVVDAHEATGVGVDPKTNRVYVAESEEGHEQIVEYEPSGELLSTIATPGSVIRDLAIDGASGRIYAPEVNVPGGRVLIFGPDTAVPSVTTGPASDISETGATLTGHVDPDEAHGGLAVSQCVFEYGTSTFYGHTVPCSPPAPYAAPTDVSASISGLQRGATYHFRIKATSANGSSEGQDETFTASGLALIDSASAHVNGTSAILRAQINPLHLDTTCQVQYVEDASFKASGYATATTVPCAPGDLGSGAGDQAVQATASGLKVATSYHYRFLASSEAGLTGSTDRTFVTWGAHSATFEVIDREGRPSTQAAGHPYELATGLQINTYQRSPAEIEAEQQKPEYPDGNVKDVITKLPPGLIGDPSVTPKCTREQVLHQRCFPSAQVGVIAVKLESDGSTVKAPIFNVIPPKGIAAEFAASILEEANVYIDAKLRSGGDYGVTAASSDNGAIGAVGEVHVRLWGVPAEESHDNERYCSPPGGGEYHRGCSLEERVLKPFLRNPSACSGPLTTTLELDSWQDPGDFAGTAIPMDAISGCPSVPFTPTLQLQPTTTEADTPTGLHVDLHIPQSEHEAPGGLAEADLKDTSVTLPPGLTTNGSAANGLQACSPAQVGLTSPPGTAPATPVTFTPDPAGCPDAAKIGTVEVDTPLLSEEQEGHVLEEGGHRTPHVLHGAVYVATPYDNPFNSLLAIYIAIYDEKTGIVVKLAGEVKPDPQTGQLTTTFSDSPQLPFEDFKLDFFAGPRAALATPEGCGSYTPTASLTPWSETAPVSPEIAGFVISSNCVTGFSPVFSAGTTSAQAGAVTPFTLSFSRSDADQELAGLSATLPPGLLAKIAGVGRCSDAQLAAAAAPDHSGAAEQANPSCPASSLLGSVQAASGAGKAPFVLPGKIYLTGPYNGGPYGLAVVVPAIAGPFDLGTVVVRQSLRIDPNTAQVTAVSDPFPMILKGIPIRLRRVDATIDRSDFTFNPTNCNPMAVAANLTSAAGINAPVSQRFQVGGCSKLPFKPDLKASTSGVTSKANGASLTVTIAAKPGEANIAKVLVQLPLALPSRLTTLQKACTEAQFNANPAGCPEGSNVGSAIAHTPVLNVPLSGPAYLVSHGNAAFPDLEFVLSGEGVRIVLDGKTDIKKGITYSRFETVPDAPITSFETSLPQGPHSVLTANANLCSATKTVTVRKRVAVRRRGRVVHVLRRITKHVITPLSMPTTIAGQNGAVITQMTPIAVTGCPHQSTHGGSHRRKRGSHRKR